MQKSEVMPCVKVSEDCKRDVIAFDIGWEAVNVVVEDSWYVEISISSYCSHADNESSQRCLNLGNISTPC